MSQKHPHSYINLLPPKINESKILKIAKKIQKIAKFLALVGFGLIAISYGPSVIYLIQSGGRNLVSNQLVQTAKESDINIPKKIRTANSYTPPFDPSLPVTNSVKISSIGVNTTIREATYENYEDALRLGVWRVADFGAPGSPRPMILAAHRYGYLAWTNAYRRENSFFNLPKVKVGDIIEVVWHQRKYTYEVYAEGRGEQIDDYSGDLILYTCVTLTGEERIFKYAKLLEI